MKTFSFKSSTPTSFLRTFNIGDGEFLILLNSIHICLRYVVTQHSILTGFMHEKILTDCKSLHNL